MVKTPLKGFVACWSRIPCSNIYLILQGKFGIVFEIR